MRQWLGPFAAGCALTSFISIGAYWYSQEHQPISVLELAYNGDLGWLNSVDEHARYPNDLHQKMENYLSKIAAHCKLSKWEMHADLFIYDASMRTWISIEAKDLSDNQFDCLVSSLRPPYVTLSRTTH